MHKSKFPGSQGQEQHTRNKRYTHKITYGIPRKISHKNTQI